jgi:putative methyltransferase (TIGR04325 family)
MRDRMSGRFRDLTPGILACRLVEQAARILRLNSSMWSGDYPDWSSAAAACRSYGPGPMCEAYARAHRALAAGSAHHERDGILFEDPRPEWPLLTALASLATGPRQPRTVLDFGGGFGAGFFQNRAWLDRFGPIQWAVVELPEVTRAARTVVDDPAVRFFNSIHEATDAFGPPDVVVAAGVLPYVPDPNRTLEELAALRAPWTLIERLAVLRSAQRHRLTRQAVPECIYRMESPFWFFAHDLLNREIASRFRIAGTSVSACDDPGWIGGQRFEWAGFVLEPAI